MAPFYKFRAMLALVMFIFAVAKVHANSLYTYQSYQQSVSCAARQAPAYPRSLSEIQNIIQYAVNHNVTVKAVGRQHSISDLICTTGIPLYLSHVRHFSYNYNTHTATVGAGMDLDELLEKLNSVQRTLTGLPNYNGITIGGALALGVHGTGLKSGTLSQQVVAMTVVDGRGIVRRIHNNDYDFLAFGVSLGLLGIIYEVELFTEQQHKLKIRHYPLNDVLLRNNPGQLLDYANRYDYFQFWWFPTNQQITLALGSRLSVNASGDCETRYIPNVSWLASTTMATAVETMQTAKDDLGYFNLQSLAMQRLYMEVLGREPFFVKGDGITASLPEATGYSHKMTTNRCENCVWVGGSNVLREEVGSIAIPLRNFVPAMKTLVDVFDKQLTQFPVKGILVRFLRGSGNAYMGINEGNGDWVVVEWTSVLRWDKAEPRLGLAGFQIMGQILVDRFNGRPHWARNGLVYSSPEMIRKTRPNLEKFVMAMKSYDPYETFMNHFGERIKHGREYYTISVELAAHCAVNEICICSTNRDCGKEGPVDYSCASFPGYTKYRVCLPGSIEKVKENLSRSVIQAIATDREEINSSK